MAEAKKKAAKTKKADEKEKQVKEAELVAEAAPVAEPIAVEEEKKPTATAKAGKRSVKAQKEAEEKESKEARKADSTADTPEAKKAAVTPPRSKVERAGKKYKEAAKLIEKDKLYDWASALELATKTSTTKFDATIELHMNLGVDPRQADQNVRGTVTLPEGTGNTLRVAVFADTEDDKKATAAGADLVGADKIAAELDKETINFDVLVATPNMMPKLAKYAKLLGPKGLMPNPKSGTVSQDVAKAVKESKAGKVEYRVDSAGIIHLGLGKVSFGKDKLNTNAQVVVSAVKAAKPASLKGIYIKAIHISTTMGPSIKVQP